MHVHTARSDPSFAHHPSYLLPHPRPLDAPLLLDVLPQGEEAPLGTLEREGIISMVEGLGGGTRW